MALQGESLTKENASIKAEIETLKKPIPVGEKKYLDWSGPGTNILVSEGSRGSPAALWC